MRWWMLALCLFGCAPHASASDFDVPTLRGSSPFIPAAPKYTRWAGIYGGGWGGYHSTTMNFADATESLIAYMLRTTALENEQHPSTWGVLGKASVNGSSTGVFVGYNTQWDDAIVSIELNYNRGGFFANAPVAPITRVVSAGGNAYLLNLTGDASMRITDFGSARVRAGWVAGNFLPYGTLGIAVGRADVTRSAQADGVENPPAGYPGVPCSSAPNCTEFNFTASDSKKAAFLYGWSAGVGMDVLVMPNLFLRTEYEMIGFSRFQGITATIQSIRFGAGLKF